MTMAGYVPSRDPGSGNYLASGVFEVHHKVPGGLGHPACGRVGGGTQDPDPASSNTDSDQYAGFVPTHRAHDRHRTRLRAKAPL